MEGTNPTNLLNHSPEMGKTTPAENLNFLWLELTGLCQLECEHCYANSGPTGNHGTMIDRDWMNVIDQAAEQDVGMVQLIGGEPTLHPALLQLVDHALAQGIETEVYSNLVHISERLWECFSKEGVSLATSYYSHDPEVHNEITKRPAAHERTRRNIQEAVRRGIPLRVGIIGIRAEQDIAATQKELEQLGVAPDSIGVDYLRQVGRGVRGKQPSPAELCGNCAKNVLAIQSDGTVRPCVFTRWEGMEVGNVRTTALGDILESEKLWDVRGKLSDTFRLTNSGSCKPGCRPDCQPNCPPAAGQPCKPECQPRCLPNQELPKREA